MRTLKMTLAYDGTDFVGWQVQPNGTSVQSVLEAALKSITGEERRITASGRTDSGVHALRQVAEFACDTTLSNEDLRRALNASTPESIFIHEIVEAPKGFHAIRDAIRKRYRYVLADGRVPDVFDRAYCWHHWRTLDVDAMNTAAQLLVGTHDFVSFQATRTERLTTVRTITNIGIRRVDVNAAGAGEGSKIVFEVEADGFLYNMVRNIVGTLVEVGHKRRPIEWVSDVLAAKNRQLAGQTAPPHALFLVSVDY